MLVFDDFGAEAAKHAGRSKRGRPNSRLAVSPSPEGVRQPGVVKSLRLLPSTPPELAKAAESALNMARQTGEHISEFPGKLADRAASLVRILAASAPAEASKPAPAPTNEKVKLGSPFLGTIRPEEMLSAMTDLGQHLMARPQLLAEQTAWLIGQWGQAISGNGNPVLEKRDRRFEDPAWRTNPWHRMSLHAYLAWTTALGRLIDGSGAERETKERARYVTDLVADALAPSNALLGNPAALKRAMETGGESLLSGMRNLLRDLAEHQTTPSQVDKSAFTMGKNIAATPGAVVHRSDVLELLQYTPTTEKVRAIPVMMVPPVVNKFYMMDTAPGRSLVEFLVAEGFQVFMLSWRNPEAAHADWGLDTYVSAMIEAAQVMRDITGAAEINLFTICTGAVPLMAYLGHQAAQACSGIRSATTVVSILDSNEGQSLGLFATPETIAEAKRHSAAKGVLTGEEMAEVFTWMRPRDLVWSYWVNNYLMGQRPPALDLLYWNNDPIRLAARLHAELLDIYHDDLLVKPGAVKVLGTPIDLSRIQCDTYVVGGLTDHISVWKGVYASARRLGGKVDFVLHSSGHVQSVINPPGTPKARYWTNPETPDAPEAWLDGAQECPDSWWRHWSLWLAQRSGEWRPAPSALGNDRHPAGVAAPGSYVVAP